VEGERVSEQAVLFSVLARMLSASSFTYVYCVRVRIRACCSEVCIHSAVLGNLVDSNSSSIVCIW
jgi:hypothetical protein